VGILNDLQFSVNTQNNAPSSQKLTNPIKSSTMVHQEIIDEIYLLEEMVSSLQRSEFPKTDIIDELKREIERLKCLINQPT
jgi:hypothetical protein